MIKTILHHPRKLWLRRALFQIHLWLGLLIALYAVVISISGTILVFESEIRRISLPHAGLNAQHMAAMSTVIANTHARYPAEPITYVAPPHEPNPWWTVYLEDPGGRRRMVYADAATGALWQQKHALFIDTMLDLHVYLLMGATGYVVNCLAGIGLLVLAITGVVLWWPGIRLWKRGLTIALRRKWKRVNYDTHAAVGFWSLLIVSWWGLTAVYFLAPAKFIAAVNAVSPLVSMREPQTPESQPGGPVADIDSIVAQIPAIAPGYLDGVTLPEKPGAPVTAYVDVREAGNFLYRDILTFDGHTGKLLSVWHYGENKSLGDWILWLIYPLHFGTLWGLPVKIAWAALGLGVAVLSVTGVLMYWNRYLSARWHALAGK